MTVRTLVLVALLAALSTTAGAQDTPELKLRATITWDLGLRVGVDYRPWDHVGFGADIGSTLFSLEGALVLTGDAFVSLYATPPENNLQLSARLGVPDWRCVFVRPLAAEIAFGASAEVEYAFSRVWGGFLRVGAGVPVFMQDGTTTWGGTSFPLGLWPDLSLGGTYVVP